MKQLLNILSQKWAEYLLEILVITIGIVGAFALNNWNEARKQRIEEIELLKNIQIDLIKAQAELKELNTYRERILESTKAFYSAIRKEKQFESHQLDSMMADLNIAPTYNNQTGTINTLFNSGKITTISNLAIREELLAWPQSVDDITEEEVYANNYLFRDMLPLVRKYIPVYQLNKHIQVRYFSGTSKLSGIYHGKPSAFESNYSDLLENMEFEGILANRELLIYLGILQGNQLIDKAGEIINLINEEIAK